MAKRGVKLGSKRGHYKSRVTDDFEKYLRKREKEYKKGYDLEKQFTREEFKENLTALQERFPLRTKQQLITDIVDSQKPFDYWESKRLVKAIKEKEGLGEILKAENGTKIKIESYKDIIGMDKNRRKVFFSVLVDQLGYTYREAEEIYES